MADIREWKGVLISFKYEDKLISWEADSDIDHAESIEYLCYECFQPILIDKRKLKRTECSFDHVQWVNNGHALPIYTTNCSGCQNVLNISTEYCCIDHQIRIVQLTRQMLLKIMIEQITLDKTLCPYIVLQAHMSSNIEQDDIIKLISTGKEHISLFISTPAGLMLDSLANGDLLL